jgi:oligosaccharide reducing-end xylanase
MARSITSWRFISPPIGGATGKGIYNYKAQADELLSRMLHRPVIAGEVPWRGTNADCERRPAVRSSEHKMVLFTPSDERSRFSDPSYHLPAFYELWSRWGPKEDAQFWKEAAQSAAITSSKSRTRSQR